MIPIRYTITTRITVRCSTPECLSAHDVDHLPMILRGTVPSVDVPELAASMPGGWVHEAAEAAHFLFCPTCAKR